MSTNISNSSTTVSQINIATQKATVEAEYNALINAIEAELGDVTSFVIRKVTFTKQDLVTKFKSRVDAAQKTKADRTTLHMSVATEQAVEAEVGPLRAGMKQYLQSRYGKDSADLQKFGFTPAKVPQRPVASKAASIVKNKATRVARNTLGKKARLAVKAPTTAAAPAPGPAPAPAPAPAAAPRAVPNPGGATT